MSTNFYFVSRKSAKETEEHNIKVGKLFMEFNEKLEKLVGDHNDHISILNCEPDFLKEPERIHIGKRSMGWKPLFASNKYYATIKQMEQWYKDNVLEYYIADEYGTCLDWGQLYEELVQWNGEKSNVGLSSNYLGYSYSDKDGYEWSNLEFS